ncbi:succinylglutamate desuccinylase/aspartoacylase family protein [Pelistega sp. NLN82]|uniref:Succinylglutamate desuccinylase/aspartoacylase family protein n=1 Tax=Pelistega ratti TaxID=2652177 RepID=A0A6L9Y8I0_9BURK|nr:succinylglutamate desuccinylase/aspartoacylase family protein [Pelistega ratti]NEN76044.1 succinylglutamate desuccinylase/aspartoacylase family protein [Pelistega ratti]
MRREQILLERMPLGSQASITALHFGNESLPKVYIQASLHADEMPGSLAAYYLHQQFLQLEKENRLNAHIVLVPLCNPLGLGQLIDYMPIGRFHLGTGQNFNRLFTVPLRQKLEEYLEKKALVLGHDARKNTVALREAIRNILVEIKPNNAVHSMHLSLLRLCYDADIVLDLHCDNIATVHLYTLPSTWHDFEPLARYLGSKCQLLSMDSGADSFDEILSTLWVGLQERYPSIPIPQALISATVELRGERDLSHKMAQKDAEGIIQFLAHKQYISLDKVSALPPLLNPPHPLEGLYYVPAPCSGIIVYRVGVDEWVKVGQPLVDIVDPISLHITTVKSPYEGYIFALSGVRVAHAENKLLSISCSHDIGSQGLSP